MKMRKLRNLRISRQFNLAISIILLLILVLALISWFSIEGLWNYTDALYRHPLTVRRALEAVEVDVLSMYGELRQLVVENDRQAEDGLISKIDSCEADADRQLQVLYDRYLGDQHDVDGAHDELGHWKTIRDETIRLLRTGQAEEAGSRVKAAGADGVQVDTIMGYLNKISDFANNKANEFYTNAETGRIQNAILLAAVFLGVLGILLAIGYALRRGIMTPLKDLTSATDALRQGKLDARSSYAAANEFGKLSDVFNGMADTLQTEMRHKENIAKISETMFRQNSLRPFCKELLSTLLQFTQSQIGAVYFLDHEKQQFERFESIGLSPGDFPSFSNMNWDGEFGAVLATGHIQHITDIDSDIKVTFSAVSGEFRPKEIITIPILDGSHIIAVISLASIKSYSPASVRLLDSLVYEISARLNAMLASQLILEFSQKLQKNNAELEAQTKELAVQADELKEQNIELEMQKKQLDEASKIKSSFLANMSHELRTPLNSVIGLASVLNRRVRGMIPEEEYGYLDVIERNGKHLLALVNDILDLSRIEAGKEEIRLTRFSMKALVHEIVETTGTHAKSKGIAMTDRVSGDIPDVVSDMNKCRHILQNIIGNAVKFTDKGKVVISSRVAGGEIHILVSDTGIGISPAHLDLIFDEFRQVDETASRRNGGTGLGLAIARKYAGLIGGSIAVESTPGKGSTFTLRLPLETHKPSAPEGGGPSDFPDRSRDASRQALPAGHNKRILLVEDSEPAVIQISDILKEQDYLIDVARSGKEALDYIEHNEPDGIILDLMMPEIDGFQVLAAIRGIKKEKLVPVLILTAKHITESELKFLKGNHVYQLIQKGDVSKSELLNAVWDMVSRQNEKASPPTKKAKRAPAQGKPVILLVEDNPDNRIAARAMLKEQYEIAEAADGQTGIEQAVKLKPSLILLDISLPVLDGYQVLAAIRKEESLRHVPVVALTARAMAGDREEILAHGFDGYVSKPISGKELDEAIRRCLDGDE